MNHSFPALRSPQNKEKRSCFIKLLEVAPIVSKLKQNFFWDVPIIRNGQQQTSRIFAITKALPWYLLEWKTPVDVVADLPKFPGMARKYLKLMLQHSFSACIQIRFTLLSIQKMQFIPVKMAQSLVVILHFGFIYQTTELLVVVVVILFQEIMPKAITFPK